MYEVRCPYCVEGDEFKVMTPQEDHLVCFKCGHVVVPDIPIYVCSCQKCVQLNRPTKAFTRRIR